MLSDSVARLVNTSRIRTLSVVFATIALITGALTPTATSAQDNRAATGTDPYATTSPLPLDPAVRTGTLPNGVRWFVRQNERPEQRAELRLVVNAGSLQEDDDQRGLAHFVEHMAFNGTRNFAKNDIVKYLESIGVRFGADLNAYTSFDETVYMLSVPTDSAGILDRSFVFLSDVANGVLFDSAAVVAERGVVLSEWRTGLGAGERIRNQQFPVFFQGSRYAERLPIGLPAILETANPAPVRRFWQDWYRPDLMAVVAVGDAPPAELEALIRKHFGAIPARTQSRERISATVPGHDTTLITIATDKEVTSSSVAILWKEPPTETRTVADLRRSLVERLYISMLNQRFSELAQKPDVPFLGAGAGAGNLVRGAGAFTLNTTAKEGKLLDALQFMLMESERVNQHGFLQSELDRTRTNTLRSYERAYAERDKTPSAAYVNEYISYYLENEPSPGIAFEYEAAKRLLPGITLAEVNALDNNRSGERNRVIAVTMPDKEGLAVPTAAEIRSVFARVATTAVTPWTESVAEGALVASMPTPGRVTAEVKHPEYNVTEWTLSNGVRVFIKPTDFQADQILMAGWSSGGASLVPDKDVFRTSLATLAVERGGVGDFSVIDLQKKLAGKVATVGTSVSETSQGISGRASPKDLETMLELTWLRMTAPRKDTLAYNALLAQFSAVLTNLGNNPEQAFSDTIQMTLGGGHPRIRTLNPEMLNELNLDSMMTFYKDRFGDASGFSFIFVGNVNPDTLRPMVEQWIAALPASGREETFRDVGPAHFTGHIEKTVHKGIAPKAQTIVVLAGSAPWTRADSHSLESLGDLLEMRLTDRLRENLGGTYSVGVNVGLTRVPKQEWNVLVQFGSDPQNADAMYREVLAEFDSLRTVAPSEEEVERVREQQRRAQETARKQNAWWVNSLQSRIEFGEQFSTIEERDSLIAGLTAARIHDAAVRFLNETNRARFTLLPESNPDKQ